jgi:hydroxyacylglutathione hydrolase
MILRQFLHTGPVGISYLFGCGGKASGAVVDPIGDIQFYLRAAEEAGLRIRFVIDTPQRRACAQCLQACTA